MWWGRARRSPPPGRPLGAPQKRNSEVLISRQPPAGHTVQAPGRDPGLSICPSLLVLQVVGTVLPACPLSLLTCHRLSAPQGTGAGLATRLQEPVIPSIDVPIPCTPLVVLPSSLMSVLGVREAVLSSTWCWADLPPLLSQTAPVSPLPSMPVRGTCRGWRTRSPAHLTFLSCLLLH